MHPMDVRRALQEILRSSILLTSSRTALLATGIAIFGTSMVGADPCPEGAFSQAGAYHGTQRIDGLRLAVAGPTRLDAAELQTGRSIESADILAAPDGTYRLDFSGLPVDPGQEIRVAFCFDGGNAEPIPVGNADSGLVWTLGGEAETDSEETNKTLPMATVGVQWEAEHQGRGLFALSAALGNLGFEDSRLSQADWALLTEAPDLARLTFDEPLDWQPLEAGINLPGRTDEPKRTIRRAGCGAAAGCVEGRLRSGLLPDPHS